MSNGSKSVFVGVPLAIYDMLLLFTDAKQLKVTKIGGVTASCSVHLDLYIT